MLGNEKEIKRYCCEDISLIENYEQAVKDKDEMWECHHRMETDCGLRKKDLIDTGSYYNRPASELIFLTSSEHKRIHFTSDSKWIEGLSDAKKKPIGQFDKKTGKMLRLWDCGMDIGNELGYNISAIYSCCSKNIPSAYGYIWRYVDPEKSHRPHSPKKGLF